MPNQHDPHNHQIAIKFPHPVWRQIEICAEAQHKTPGVYIRDELTLHVANTPLTAEDAQIIADRIKTAQKTGKLQ
jgi:hypothetical protein